MAQANPNLFFKIPLCKSTLWLWWRWSAWPLASKCDIYFHRQCLIQAWIYNSPPGMIHQLQLGDLGLVIHHCSNQGVWKHTGCFFWLALPNFSTKKKIAKQPFMAFLSLVLSRIFLKQQLWLADWRFSFWYWNWGGPVKKITLYLETISKLVKTS